MTRQAKLKGTYTTYHIVLRANEKKDIFISDEDRNRFIDTLLRTKEKYNIEIDSYCLMDNHVHLIIDDNGNDISQVMKSINTSYAMYFNKVYCRVGHLFQDRFRSEIVGDDSYLLGLSAYIHNNPVRAGMVEKPQNYQWSSMNDFMGKGKKKLVRTERIIDIFPKTKAEGAKAYYEFVRKHEKKEDIIMDIEEDQLIIKRKNCNFIETFEKGSQRLKKELEKRNTDITLMKKDKDLRKEMMKMLRKNSALTLTQIGELCGGYAESTVCLILKGKK